MTPPTPDIVSPSDRESRYRADIDGLRSVAIVPVLLFHAGLGLTGGYVGVDVFFVISGFLIASVVQTEIDRGEFSIVRFWERRVRRLFPALSIVLLAVLAAGGVLLLPRDFRELGQSVVAQGLLAANFYFCREAGYFAGPSEIKPLLHTWSLAVEEQFYVLLPPLLLLLSRVRGRMAVLIALLIASLAWSAYSTQKTPDSAFFLLPARAWELLLGVILAFGYSRIVLPKRVFEGLSVLGLLMIGWSCVQFDQQTAFPGVAALLPCLGAALVIAGGGRGSPTLVERLLSTKPFVMIGLLSYSIYLWHWPLFAYANYLRFAPLGVGLRLALIGVSVGLAAASWALVEQPFRRRTLCGTRRGILSLYAVGTCALMAIGLGIHAVGGWPERFSPEVLSAAEGATDTNPQRKLRHDLPNSIVRRGLPRLGDAADDRPPVLAVIGDSHGDAFMPVMDALCSELHVPAVAVSRSATIPLFCGETERDAGKRAFQEAVREQLDSAPSIQHVLLVARWADHKSDVMNADNLRKTVSELAALGKHVWILRQVPEQPTSVPRALALSLHWKRDLSDAACTWQDYCAHSSAADALFQRLADTNVQVLDPSSAFFPERDRCRISCDGRPLYVDDDHLSVSGALQLRAVVAPVFQAISADQEMPTAVK
ncbi:MAG: acyltransferase [Planctomycetaceae bacterium]|nr:acyltransferase [Planctomycetaceae bacterium]